MLMAVSSGACDFVCTDMPTAQGAVLTYPNLKILDFSNSQDNFNVSAEEINIGISVREGNKTLLDAMNKVLSPMNADAFNALLAQAVAIQPIEE
jgi:putative lysine transport system substrate-binding protein